VTTQHPANQARTGRSTKGSGTSSSTSVSKEKVSISPIGTKGNPYEWELVEIHWIDAVADGLTEWLDPEQVMNLTPVDSRVVGYLVNDTVRHITVASLINEGSAAHVLCIPKELVVEIHRLVAKK